ncbi:MAG: hypothetical protein ABI895_04375 [Deltaproteobacteria bacterium]
MSETDLTEELFARHPIWKWDDAMEGHEPVLHYDPFPDEEGTLFVRARFTAASGEEFAGYLVGIEIFYAVGLFVMGEEHVLNWNLPDRVEGHVKRIKELLQRPALQMFPLKYRDDVHFQLSPPLIGEFNP